LGASASNSSIVMSPSLVFMVATDIPALLSLLVGARRAAVSGTGGSR
jgi:hypothetical protein